MIFEEIGKLEEDSLNGGSSELLKLESLREFGISIYTKSINNINELTFFIGKVDHEKFMFLITEDKNSFLMDNFKGEIISLKDGNFILKKCRLVHLNAVSLQRLFPFTKPVLTGITNSFGFGDRLGIANPAHIRSLSGSNFMPIIAQQSIRELSRTNRTADEVMDAAIWAVFQEGYRNGFGADADHLKTMQDIDIMIHAGFTMFTFDPGDFVINEADSLHIIDIENRVNDLNWTILENSLTDMVNRYTSTQFNLSKDFTIVPTYEEVLRAILKYGNAIAHIKTLFDHLKNNYSDKEYEIEISVDETESVTSTFEHLFMISELNRLGVKIISLAPRFVGDFEKGIDYKGDIELFKEEYLKHVKIVEHFGPYKISLHSGSDKFGVYKAIGQLKRGYTHVKTAGTSYLEALKVVAFKKPEIFRTILDFSRDEFEKEKLTYHVSAELENVKPSEHYSDDELLKLFEQNDPRQILHVTFGKVLTTKDDENNYLFKDLIFECLEENEELHYKYIINHFRNHLKPFE